MYVDVNGLKLYYEVHGEGSPLLLIMGLGIDHSGWDHLWPSLAETHRCIVYDHRGTGASSFPPGPYSIPELALDAARLLDELGLGPAHVCGASMGGAIALRLAAERPDLLLSLALHSTWHRTDGLIAEILALRRPILDRLGPAVLQRYIELWAFTSDHWSSRAGADQFEAMYETAHSDEHLAGWLSHLDAAISHDCDDDLSRITAPTLVAVGDEDIITPLRFARVMAARISNAHLEVLPHAAHGYFFETPDRFIKLQLAFLAELESS